MSAHPECGHCPLTGTGKICPSWDWPAYCQHAESESTRHPDARYWTGQILKSAGLEPPAPIPPHTLVLRGHADSSTGYGRLIGHLARELEALGQPTLLSAVAIDESRVPLDPFLRARLLDRRPSSPILHVDSRPDIKDGSAVFTMWESSRLPADRVEILNRARFLVVPCHFNVSVFRDSGVTVPIRVVPLGVDPSVYRPTSPEPEGEFVVLNTSRLAHGGIRKNVAALIAAFIEALGDRPDARLHLKLWPDCDIADPGHPRITLDRGSYDDAGLARLYQSASIYASLSRGEGFGLPLIEAMACGRPVLCGIHSGIADFATPECAYPVEYDTGPSEGDTYSGGGDWHISRHASAVEQLRLAYADGETRRAKGVAAARIASGFPWSRSARELLAVVREFGLVGVTHGSQIGRSSGAHVRATPTARPEVAHQVKLAQLRGACPSGSKPSGCGCGDELDCSKLGRRANRATCYSCLEGSEKSASTVTN